MVVYFDPSGFEKFISLTDMLKAKDGDYFISDWLRNRNIVEFLGVWESIYNPKFNYGEFAIFKSQVLNNNKPNGAAASSLPYHPYFHLRNAGPGTIVQHIILTTQFVFKNTGDVLPFKTQSVQSEGF